MIADYFFIRNTRLDTEALYRRDGAYEYTKGVNVRAMIALGAGLLAALIGVVVPELRALYDYAWFVGFGVAATVYVALMEGAKGAGGATPLAQRIAGKVLDPALGTQAGAGAKAFVGDATKG
jgi:cytosine/uracil/thiamine/allantoin permease